MKPPTVAEQADFDLLGYVQNRIMKELHDHEWGYIQNILHTHIDNPIDGELTKQKLKAANIKGLIYQEESIDPQVDWSAKGMNIIMTSNILGIRQGDTLIQHNGNRMPVGEIPVAWFEMRFCYDD
jgi:hypothetical protein